VKISDVIKMLEQLKVIRGDIDIEFEITPMSCDEPGDQERRHGESES
jgi:hypothetical protein